MLFLALMLQEDAALFDDPQKEIQWARSFDEAFAQAKLRNVPVLVLLTSDN